MNNLFTLKKDLWHAITLSDPALLSEATLQKLIALTDYLENEVQEEYKLSEELITDIRLAFNKRVWHYTDEEEFELSIKVMLDLLVESIMFECRRYNYSEEKVASICSSLKDVVCCIPETLEIHESKIRAIVIRAYIFEKFIEKGCPEELVYQIVPSHKEIERRLLMDILER